VFACVEDIKPRKRQSIVLLYNTYYSLLWLLWKVIHIFSRGNVCGMWNKMSFKLFLSCKHRHISSIQVSFVQSKTYIYVMSLTVIFGGPFVSLCEKLLLHSHIPLRSHVYCHVCVCHKVQKIHPKLEHRNINYRFNPTSIFTAIFVIHCPFIQQNHRTSIYFLGSAAKKEFKPFNCFDLFFEVTKHNL